VIADVEYPVGHIAAGRVRIQGVKVGIGLGRLVQYPQHPFHDIVDVGEIPLHLAVVEDVDGAAFQNGFGEQEQGHVRAAPGAVDGEKAQPGGGQAEEMAVGVGHQFVGLLGGRIEAHRMVHAVVFGEGQLFVAPVNAGAAGIDQVFHLIVAATFQDIDEAG